MTYGELVVLYGQAIAALKEVRPEITRLNQAAGYTVFNPAATQMVDAEIRNYELFAGGR